MKTTLSLINLWSVLALSLILVGALATYQSAARPGNGPKLPTTGGRHASSRRFSFPRAAEAPLAVQQVRQQSIIQPSSSNVPDVSVACSASDLVLRVKPTFYGLFADKEELRLGDDCQSNGVLRPYGDLLFTYPLTACGVVRQVGPTFVSGAATCRGLTLNRRIVPHSRPLITSPTNLCSIINPRSEVGPRLTSTLNAAIRGLEACVKCLSRTMAHSYF